MEATEATITKERGRGNQEVLTSTTCSNTIITNIRAIKRSTVSLTQQVGFSCYENTHCIFNWPAALHLMFYEQINLQILKTIYSIERFTDSKIFFCRC